MNNLESKEQVVLWKYSQVLGSFAMGLREETQICTRTVDLVVAYALPLNGRDLLRSWHEAIYGNGTIYL